MKLIDNAITYCFVVLLALLVLDMLTIIIPINEIFYGIAMTIDLIVIICLCMLRLFVRKVLRKMP